jgi:anti-anti-sigma factor
MDSQRFQVTQEYSVNVMQFVLPVTMDTMEVDTLIDAVLKTLDGKNAESWVVDLSQVGYMGSSMLGLFVNVRERIRQGSGTLVLCGMSPQLLRIFKTCCLERLFTIAKSRADALALVSGR